MPRPWRTAPRLARGSALGRPRSGVLDPGRAIRPTAAGRGMLSGMASPLPRRRPSGRPAAEPGGAAGAGGDLAWPRAARRAERAERLRRRSWAICGERFDLALSEPTPEEVSVHLARRGFPDELGRAGGGPAGRAVPPRGSPRRMQDADLAEQGGGLDPGHRGGVMPALTLMLAARPCCPSRPTCRTLPPRRGRLPGRPGAQREGRPRRPRRGGVPRGRPRWEQRSARSGVDTAPLYRNLGHAYFLAGDLPRAILCYRLGLRREPGEAELRAGLRQARERVVFAEGSVAGPAARRHAAGCGWPELSLGWLFALGVALHAAGWACLTRWYMVRGTRLLGGGTRAGRRRPGARLGRVPAARRRGRAAGRGHRARRRVAPQGQRRRRSRRGPRCR